jgi:hypothetical protein
MSVKTPTTLVIESAKCANKYIIGDKLAFSYKLKAPLRFEKPHSVRLQHVLGLKHDALVFADFVVESNFNSDLEQYLGCSSIYFDYNSWVPLSTNSIPDYGYCFLKSTFDNLVTTKSEFVLVLEIASEDYIYGRTPNYDILRS